MPVNRPRRKALRCYRKSRILNLFTLWATTLWLELLIYFFQYFRKRFHRLRSRNTVFPFEYKKRYTADAELRSHGFILSYFFSESIRRNQVFNFFRIESCFGSDFFECILVAYVHA